MGNSYLSEFKHTKTVELIENAREIILSESLENRLKKNTEFKPEEEIFELSNVESSTEASAD